MGTTKCDMELIHSGAGGSVNLVQRNGIDRNRASFGKNSNNNGNSDSGSRGHFNGNNNNHVKSFGGQHSNFGGQQRPIKCFHCGRNGHISKNCFRRQSKFIGKSNNSDKNSANSKHFKDENNFDFEYLNILNSFSNINTVKGGALTTLDEINGREIRMEVDTGACGTVMDIDQFYGFFHGLRLSVSNRKFSLLTGESVMIVGCVEVCVRRNSRSHQLVLTIIKASANTLPLMGQDWLDILYPGWREFFEKFDERNLVPIHELNNVVNFNINAYQSQLKSRFKHVFSNNMFQPVKNFEAEIILNEIAQPIFCKPYSVLFGAREAVEKELGRLVENGLLVPVKQVFLR